MIDVGISLILVAAPPTFRARVLAVQSAGAIGVIIYLVGFVVAIHIPYQPLAVYLLGVDVGRRKMIPKAGISELRVRAYHIVDGSLERSAFFAIDACVVAVWHRSHCAKSTHSHQAQSNYDKS